MMGCLPWRVTVSCRSEASRGRGEEWVSGRVVEWVRDTKRSQTQCVSPRGPPPLAGHTLPVDQKDRGREGESGRVREGHKEKRDSVCFTQRAASPGGSHVTCRSEGERERRGEWESGRGTQRESHTQCVYPRGEGEWKRDTTGSRDISGSRT